MKGANRPKERRCSNRRVYGNFIGGLPMSLSLDVTRSVLSVGR